MNFADCIEVHIGEEDSDHFARFTMRHDWICGWPEKPWSNRRIAKGRQFCQPTVDPVLEAAPGFYIPCLTLEHLAPDVLDSVGQEPLSNWAVLSRPSDSPQQDDSTILMQIATSGIYACKHDDFEPHENALISALPRGTADTVTQAMQGWI